MLAVEEWNNLMVWSQWENGATERCEGPALTITLCWSVKTLLSRCLSIEMSRKHIQRVSRTTAQVMVNLDLRLINALSK